VVRWAFEFRSKHALDPRVAGVAAGRGELTLRAVLSGAAARCPHQASAYGGASTADPFVPESFSGNSCLRLGPVLHEVVGASGLDMTEYSNTMPSTVMLTFTASDSTWLGNWARSHRGAELAIVLDGWIIGRAQAQTVADKSHQSTVLQGIGVHQPIELPSIGVHQPMDGAIAMTIDTAAASKPLFEDPTISP